LLRLPAKRAFQVLERAIGFGSSLRVSELDLRASGLGPRAIKQIGLLTELGLIEVSFGAQRRRPFFFSNGWRMLDVASARATSRRAA
jgi:hypothetical protein